MNHALIRNLAAFESSTTGESLPPPVRANARQRLLDIIGNCLAAVPVDTSTAVVEYVLAEEGLGQAMAIDVDRKAEP